MYLTKNHSGQFIPSDDESYEQAKKIAVGEEVKASKTRNPKFHRLAFSLLNLGFENQSEIELFDPYRMKITILAGFIHWVTDKDGKPFPLPESLSFDNMSAERFDKFYEAALTVIAKQLQTAPEDIRAELAGYE